MKDALETALVEQILSKLGLSDNPSVDQSGLETIYAAWCRKVPFDNTRKLIHVNAQDPRPLPGDTPEDFFESWLQHGTGSTCWGGNGALQALLASLGFEAMRGVATMMVAPDLPPNHGTVIVTFGDDQYLVDASILHSAPLHLDRNNPPSIDNPAWGVRTSWRDERWYINWRALMRPEPFDCRIEYAPAAVKDFRERHEASRAWSPFNFQLTNRIIKGDSVIGAALGQRIEIDAQGQMHVRDLTHEGRMTFLIEELGMSEEIVRLLPQDRPMPPPPGSETAKRAAMAETP